MEGAAVDTGDLLKQLRIERAQREDAPARRRWPWIVAAVAALLLIAAIAVAWLARGRAVAVEAVAAVPPAADAATAVLDATGYVTARRQATVSAQITGTLTEVLIEEGDHVQAGQVLARLEDTAQRANLATARAGLAAAEALLGQYQAQLAQARRDLARQQDLIGRKLTSQQALENARTAVETLAAQLAAQRSQVELARAQVRSAEVQLDYTVVRAPFAGVVTDKAAQVGEIVSPLSAGGGFTRTGIGTIVDMDSLEVEVDVNEAYIGRVKAGQPVQAVLDAYPDWKIPAAVIAIIPAADRSKATVKVRIALKAKDPRIVPDMGVKVSFLEAAPASAAHAPAPTGVLVPASALVRRDGRDAVFVIDGDRARLRPVTAGLGLGEMRQVTAGLEAGTRVVRQPPAALADGARVEISSTNE
ncbi:RND family efflux transporter, MFP subunit [Mizugakiibacter sediminis]|uniref:RND family efflux transporter, MFP subunit n=1 Tax=Mizugakiibacter sediminis TaxID=1475481 RepID=A0A0K8QK97_9GAMM|nr:efflux RND transporter periplasmic adaptor subunit [Mizugakiibacter sediminis]GAP64907.1 RND family efflux transporter, MFP subunit [Mizugakiibacter sediminis]